MRSELCSRGWRVRGLPVNDIAALAPLPGSVEQFDDSQVFAAFKRGNAGLCETLSAADVVVINGEGSLHDLPQLALGILYLAYIAKTRYGRPVHIVNHSVLSRVGSHGFKPRRRATLPARLFIRRCDRDPRTGKSRGHV